MCRLQLLQVIFLYHISKALKIEHIYTYETNSLSDCMALLLLCSGVPSNEEEVALSKGEVPLPVKEKSLPFFEVYLPVGAEHSPFIEVFSSVGIEHLQFVVVVAWSKCFNADWLAS